MTTPAPKPLALRREGEGLRIDWADGTSTFATWKHLRTNCPCAGCLEEASKPLDPFKVLKPAEVAAGPPAPVSMTPVGHYAYQITWTDGHGAGIYTLENLHALGTKMTNSQ